MCSDISDDAAREVVRRNGWALAWLATALGVAITLSGAQRWSASVWRDALKVPGAPPSFGAVMLIAAGLLLWGAWKESTRTYHHGCQIAFGWCCFVDGMQLYSLFWDTVDHGWSGTVNPIGIIIWTYLCYIFILRFRYSGKEFR